MAGTYEAHLNYYYSYSFSCCNKDALTYPDSLIIPLTLTVGLVSYLVAISSMKQINVPEMTLGMAP